MQSQEIQPLDDLFNLYPCTSGAISKLDEPYDPSPLIRDISYSVPYVQFKEYNDPDRGYIAFPEPEIYAHKLIESEHSKYEYIEKHTVSHELSISKIGSLSIQGIIDAPSNQPIQASPKVLIPNFGINNLSKQFDNLDFSATKPEELPAMALAVLEFMEQVQPHIVIGCDRGGRLFGLAMHAAWRQTRQSRPFPTIDGKLHFARVSKSEDPNVLQEKIDQIVASSKRLGEQRGATVSDDEQLRVMFIDDWVVGGGTKRLAKSMMKKHGAKTYFAVMCGEGADATGNPLQNTTVSWHDRPEEIGVNYLSTVRESQDGTVMQEQRVVAVRSAEAVSNRRRIQRAAESLQRVGVLAKIA